jgi:hypothetical protein
MILVSTFDFAQNTISSVHGQILDDFNGSLMVDLMIAAFDPIFYAHHSQVDRLFQAWQSVPGHMMPPLTQTAAFIDQYGNKACHRLGDFWDSKKLGYDFDNLPSVSVDRQHAKLLVADLQGLTNPSPNYWIFVADHQPSLHKTAPKENVMGYGLPAVGMHQHGPLAKGKELAFLLEKAPPKRLWAAAVGPHPAIVRVDEIAHFRIEPNDPGASDRLSPSSEHFRLHG